MDIQGLFFDKSNEILETTCIRGLSKITEFCFFNFYYPIHTLSTVALESFFWNVLQCLWNLFLCHQWYQQSFSTKLNVGNKRKLQRARSGKFGGEQLSDFWHITGILIWLSEQATLSQFKPIVAKTPSGTARTRFLRFSRKSHIAVIAMITETQITLTGEINEMSTVRKHLVLGILWRKQCCQPRVTLLPRNFKRLNISEQVSYYKFSVHNEKEISTYIN